MRDSKVKELVIAALMIALVYVSTNINIRTPSITGGGLVHLGMAMCVFVSIIFGKKTGAVAGGIGMALFDVLSDYFLWAPFTLVISAAIGFTVGAIAHKDGEVKILRCVLAVLAGTVIKIAGYYLTEIILYHNMLSPVASVPGNIMQMAVGGVVGVPLAAAVCKQHLIRFVKA